MSFRLCSPCIDFRRITTLLFGSSIAMYSSIAAAQYQANARIGSNVIGSTTTPGNVSYTYNETGSSATVDFTSSPIASVSYSGTVINPVGTTFLQGGGDATYIFEVSAQPFSTVPVNFLGLYSSYQGAAGELASTSFVIQSVNSSLYTYSSFASLLYGNCTAGCLQYQTFNNPTYTSQQSDVYHVNGSFQGSINMLTGADGKVSGSVQIGAGANVKVIAGTANAQAFIDPHLEIDSSYLAANPNTTLAITAGVGNAISPIPEPASYSLMLVGLAGLITARRRAALNILAQKRRLQCGDA